MREGTARQCNECHQCLPKYKGRYPKNCPDCGGAVGLPIEDAVESVLKGNPIDVTIDSLLKPAEGVD